MCIIALFSAVLALLLVLLLRHSPAPRLPPVPDSDTPDSPPRNSLPLPPPPRHVSFSVVGSGTSYSLSISPSVPLPVPRLPSSSLHNRTAPPSDSPRAPQPSTTQNSPAPADEFGRLSPPLSPASFAMHSSPKSARRLSTPLRLSLTGKRRSSSASCTSTLVHIDQVDAHPHSSPSSMSPPQSSPPPRRTRFANPFRKNSRSRTLSPPGSKFPDVSSPNMSGVSPPATPPTGRRMLVDRFKSIFKPVSPEPTLTVQSKPVARSINARLRRKPVARTQPYGPPWNAPMPVSDLTLPEHPLQKSPQTTHPPRQKSRKDSIHEDPLSERTAMSPSQLSPRAFINELDEKLTLLQHQRIQDLIPSPHP